MKKIAIYLIMILFLGISCSEDVKVNPELAGPLYGLTKGEPGSVDELSLIHISEPTRRS